MRLSQLVKRLLNVGFLQTLATDLSFSRRQILTSNNESDPKSIYILVFVSLTYLLYKAIFNNLRHLLSQFPSWCDRRMLAKIEPRGDVIATTLNGMQNLLLNVKK